MKRFIPFFFFFLLSFATYAEDLHIRFGSAPYNVSNQFIPTNNVANDNVFNKSVIGLYPLGDCGTGYSLSIFKNSIAGLGYTWVNCTPTMFNLASYKATGNAHVSLVIDLGSTYFFPNMTAFRLNFSNDKTSSEVNGHDFGELTLLDSDKNIAYTTGNCYTYEFYVGDCQYRESSWTGNKSYFTSPSGISNYMNYTAFNNWTQFVSGHNVRYIVLTNAVGMVNYSIYNLDIYGVTQANNNQLPTATVQYTTPCFNSTVAYVDVSLIITCTDPESDTCYYSDRAIQQSAQQTDFWQNWQTSDTTGETVFNPDWHPMTSWSSTNGTTSLNLAGWAFNDYLGLCDNNEYFIDFLTNYLYGVTWTANKYCWLNVKGGAQPIYWKYPYTGSTNNFRVYFQVPDGQYNFSFDLLDNVGKPIYYVNFNISNHSQLWVNDIALWKDNEAKFNSSEIYELYIGNYSIVFYNETGNSKVNSNFSGLNTAWFNKISAIKLTGKDEGLPLRYVSLFSVHMWYDTPAATLYNWTATAPTSIRISKPLSIFTLYYTDTVHKDINFTKLDYMIETKQNCQGTTYNPINGSSTGITDNTRGYLSAIDNGPSIFNYLFYIILFILFIFLIVETQSLEIAVIATGLAGLVVSFLLSGDVMQMVTSASLTGFGVTLFVTKSFL